MKSVILVSFSDIIYSKWDNPVIINLEVLPMQKFSTRLATLRKDRGLSQEDLARIINKTRSAVAGYEAEDKEPPLELVCALAKFFDVTTDYLLGVSDKKSHVERVFYNDEGNFERHFKAMSTELRPVVAKCFDSFYLLLGRDMQFSRSKRLRIYQELFHTLQSFRADIRKAVDASGGTAADAFTLSELMALQSQLKNEVCVLLDRLMQADMEIAAGSKQEARTGLQGKSAV